MINKFIKNLKLKIEFVLIYIIYIFLSTLTINIASSLGGKIFTIFGPMTKTHKIVKKNLLYIMPTASKIQINKHAKKSWSNIGKTFFELLILPKILRNKNKIIIEGKFYLDEILSKKEKVIFIGIHQSNWEILLPTIDKLGMPVSGIYRHINNHYIDKLILNIRTKTLSNNDSLYTPKGKKSAKDILEGIKKKNSIVLLVDQKDSAGENVNFFGIETKTQIGFIKIAKKYNLRIVPVQNIRNKNNTFTLKFYKPVEKLSNNLSDAETMKKLNIIIEGWIKNNPSDWFLHHNRFN